MGTHTIFGRLSLVVLLLALAGPDAPAQTAATTRVMREKLTHSQKVLEAILTSDLKGLEDHSTALVNLTKTEGWAVLRSGEYQRQSAAFVHALDDLVASAKQKNLDAAAVQYMSMTMTCFECHRHIKNTRLATP
ncbi:MAG: hypothetical protein A3G76_13415 [Acidobacteria bacterium RIFCSPLOWO2_12_FULL_65_11]|nr:MAG: hypothetical protein A3H95_02715 [Acidobacteria bacterium RIFCSPLOWO2_02_FULL_64_15]OFW34521.1 MAG: hypothetical protein A3G76_13415 [Acidobacteria bacterium RIFCSPLOWO2_12_FULL_65_11]